MRVRTRTSLNAYVRRMGPLTPARALRAALSSCVAVAAFAAPAQATTELNIIPHGQAEPGAAWLTAPGILPADTQAKMYDRLTPLYRDITPAVVQPSADGTGYYKSSKLLTDPNDPSLVTDATVSGTVRGQAVSARVRRDAYGVPHIYSATDDGAIFGAGHVTGEDRNLLLNQARTNGLASLIDLPGAPGINLVLGLYDFKPSKAITDRVEKEQTAALKSAGPEGEAVLRDIETYVAGLNTWRAANSPSTRPYTRTDIYALNGVKAQFLGEGGGSEVANETMLGGLKAALGRRTGEKAYTDLRQRNDPEHPRTGTRKASWYEDVSVANGRGVVHLRKGSYRSAALKLPDAAATSRAVAAATAQPDGDTRASNSLLVSGSRSATGKPLYVGGPQIGYNYPGLTMEMGMYSPGIKVRGATSAPFPGYMLIGRGEGFGFSLTSAGADIIDTYAERLCGGSRTKYRFDGKCRSMTTVNAGTISKGGKTITATYRTTVHGPVTGYATDSAGRPVALARKRSSAGRETTDQMLFRRLTFGRVKTPAQLNAAAALTPQTFNSLLVTDKDIAFYTSGRLPMRPRGVNPDLPTDGQGDYEWTGFMKASKHPQDANPASGLLVNWNNEPSPGWPASDERVSQGPEDRVRLLSTELARQPRHTIETVLAAANAGATQDPRGKLAWPIIRAVLAKGKSPSPLATKLVAVLDDWSAGGASWRDGDVDGTIDAAGVPAIQAVWTPLARAAMCDRLKAAGCKALRDRQSEQNAPPGGQSSGWQNYMDKDLRRLLGRPVKGKYALTYCGNGSASKCASRLWAALDKAGTSAAASRGQEPSTWRQPTSSVAIKFSPLPLATMQYTNRPSGIHQVLQLAP
ncbi:MAG: penicillin acylase family protein [Solirubrobacterales bacterium]|nr:penicillin acylase family protein [Solirubrobacterales bacterium]